MNDGMNAETGATLRTFFTAIAAVLIMIMVGITIMIVVTRVTRSHQTEVIACLNAGKTVVECKEFK